jgi:hypothetical protein
MNSKQWYAIAMMGVSLVLLFIMRLGYTNKVDRQSDSDNEQNDRKWCALLVAVDDAFRVATPTSESGKRVADAFHQRRVDLGC